MNVTDILLLAVIALALVLAVKKWINDRRRGKTCGCDCAGCSIKCSGQKKK